MIILSVMSILVTKVNFSLDTIFVRMTFTMLAITFDAILYSPSF
jgi:hypothetical protein